LKSRGWLVVPDPEDPACEQAFKAGAIREFERHFRPGMVEKNADKGM